MSLPVAIVPVKRLAEAKSRLGPRLDPAARAALVVGMLRSVLSALGASGVVGERVVVSPDPAVLAVARAAGASALPQRDDGLNQALEAARASLPLAPALLILPADLPLLGMAEVRGLVALSRTSPGIVLTPDRERQGTNALVVRPADALPFQFGPDSFRRHQAAAWAAGLAVEVYQAPALALDLDTPADLDELRRLGWPPFGYSLDVAHAGGTR